MANLLQRSNSILKISKYSDLSRILSVKPLNGGNILVSSRGFIPQLDQKRVELRPPCILENTRNIFLTSYFCHESKQSVQCWKCGTDVDEKTIVFCKKCKVVQRPKSDANYFEVLGIQQDYDLNTNELTKKFRKMQMQLHPDRFTQKQEEEQNVSAEYSSLLNRAYRTLLSPVERGLYILELEGFPLLEGEVDLGQNFYFQIMELNEELAEAESAEEIERLENQNQHDVDSLLKDLSAAFKQRDWVAARQTLAKLKYFVNIQEKIKAMLQERGIVKN